MAQVALRLGDDCSQSSVLQAMPKEGYRAIPLTARAEGFRCEQERAQFPCRL
ncbi:MAG: hypothetical protein IJY04_04710 [Clostridia bacterium]|nr:hypothetical protein [Clostridia bacterium]